MTSVTGTCSFAHGDCSVPGAVLDAEDTVRYKDTDTEDMRQI